MDPAPTRLAPLPLGERLKLFGLLLIAPVLIAGVGSTASTPWIETASYVAALGITLALGWWSMRLKAATCPRCGKKLEKAAVTMNDRNVRVECEHCFEWSISDGGTLRPFLEADAADVDGFTAPVFEGVRWPGECAVCGAAATRQVEAKARTVHGAALLVGKVAWSRALVSGIPVCDAHPTGIGLEIEQLGAVRFVFPDYASRSRYVSRHEGMIPATVR